MAMSYSFRLNIAPPKTLSSSLQQIAQMSSVGNFLAMWNNTELIIEMVIKRELGLTLEQASVICSPLGGGAKTELLIGLFAERADLQPFVAAVRELQQHVSRNWLVHGFITFDDKNGPWDIVHREVKNGLKVKRKRLVDWYNDDFLPAFNRMVETSGFNDQDVHDYGLKIRALAKAP